MNFRNWQWIKKDLPVLKGLKHKWTKIKEAANDKKGGEIYLNSPLKVMKMENMGKDSATRQTNNE